MGEGEVCSFMNKKSNEIASNLENELRRLMPLGSGISAQAEISFRPGSIILEGSVILLCWAGKVALEPIRDELASIIRTATRRVLLRLLEYSLHIREMTLDVAPMPGTPSSAPERPHAAEQEPTRISPGRSTHSTWHPIGTDLWFFVSFGIVAVLLMLLLADRILSSGTRNIVLTAPPVSSSPPVSSPPAGTTK